MRATAFWSAPGSGLGDRGKLRRHEHRRNGGARQQPRRSRVRGRDRALAGGVTIGGTAPADRNLVSGQALNFSRGIELYDSSNNTIQGNYVGTNAAGTAALGNAGAGIGVDGSPGVASDNNLIGGAVAGAGNLCSGGGTEGIYVSVDSNANTIQGNFVGVSAAGTLPIPNLVEGIKIQSPGNTVGGDTPARAT